MIRILRPLVVCSVFLSSFLHGQNKYAGEFLTLGAGARASALGGAMIASVGDVTSGYYNPAGLVRLNNAQIAYNHAKLFISDINYDYGAFALPWGDKRSFGFTFLRLGVDNIAHTEAYRVLPNGDIEVIDASDYDPNTDRVRLKNYFNYASYAVYLTYARWQTERFSYGANVKMIYDGARYASAYGIGFDVGAQYTLTPEWSIGATVQDITGTLVTWNTGKREWITPSLKLGAAYNWWIGDDHVVTPMLDVQNYFENRDYASHVHAGAWSADVHAGVEYGYKRALFMRAGFNELSAWTMGTGVKLGIFQFDYAYTYFQGVNALGDIHRIHVQFDIKSPRLTRKTRVE